MTYRFSEDLLTIREILGMTQSELAKELRVQQVTISRNESALTKPSESLLEKVYGFAYDRNIVLNSLKSMFWQDRIESSHTLLFHGAKSSVEGEINTVSGRSNNDFGSGFYTGENYSQAISFISGFDHSSVYLLDFDSTNLKCKEYGLTQEWMLTIAFFRGTLNSYKDHPLIKKTVEDVENCDYLIAPIADNRMYQIISSFIEGEVTDQQCMHCLASTNLGNQFVFKREKSVKQLKILERMYVPSNEREYYKSLRIEETASSVEKVKNARIKYRGKGRYIDEILKD